MRKIKIILKKDVENLGQAGEIKEVRPGYFRNFLFRKKLALIATKKILEEKKIEERKAEKERKIKEDKLLKRAGELKNLTIEISRKAKKDGKLYAPVREKDIAEKISGVKKTMIEISKPIEKVGKYRFLIKFSPQIKTKLKLIVKRD